MTASIPLRIYLQHQFSKVCALERTDGENSPYFVFNYPAETPPYQGFSALRFQTPHLISSLGSCFPYIAISTTADTINTFVYTGFSG
jgi:hypothetical protein